MDTRTALSVAGKHLQSLKGHVFNILTVTKPVSPNAALNLAKVISKLSPLLGNLIEFNTVEILNDKSDFKRHGTWRRQDPGFPDTIFQGSIKPVPGFEIKAWFPLATEITARFKDSQNHFTKDNTHVAMLAWLPEKVDLWEARNPGGLPLGEGAVATIGRLHDIRRMCVSYSASSVTGSTRTLPRWTGSFTRKLRSSKTKS